MGLVTYTTGTVIGHGPSPCCVWAWCLWLPCFAAPPLWSLCAFPPVPRGMWVGCGPADRHLFCVFVCGGRSLPRDCLWHLALCALLDVGGWLLGSGDLVHGMPGEARCGLALSCFVPLTCLYVAPHTHRANERDEWNMSCGGPDFQVVAWPSSSLPR